MNIKDIGKGLRKLGKSKIAKEITEEVTDESLESITKGLLEKNKELLNSVGNQWKKEPIDTTGALSHLPEIKPMPKGALRNKGESVISKSPLRVIERTGKYRSGYDVVGMSSDFDIEGVIKSRNARNYLIGSLDTGPFETRYLLGGKPKKTPENKFLQDRVSFNVNAQNYIDNGVDAPYWVRKRAGRTNVKPKQEIKNRRKDNREVKEISVNRSTQQEQQLLLEAPKQKEPRKPRREYKADLGTNTEPIELSGPAKNRRKGNRPVKETPVDSSVQQSQQLLLDAPKQKGPRREYKPNLGTNMEPIALSGPVTKEKDYRLPNNDVQPESPIDSAPQNKSEPKNKQVDVSIDDFKPADEIDFDDDNEIDVTHLFEEDEPQKTQNISEKENPIDVSNVLNDQQESPFNIDDFSMPDIDEIDIEKKLWKDAVREEQPKEPSYRKNSTYDYNLHKQSDLYIDPKDRKSIISRRNQGDYNANLTNGFVDDITVNDETYKFKYRKGDKTVVDIYDSNDNIITDKDLYNDILNKGKQERDNFYRNLSDEEWDTVINNAEDYRFNKRKGALKSNEKLLNQNDAIDMKQQVLKEKSTKYQSEFENEKKKKKRKEIEKKRNNSEIDILEAEKLKNKNKLKLEARNERQSAREAFQKRVKEEGLEKGTEAYNEALKDLKDAFKNSEKTMDKRISSSDKILNSQIKGWSGKGLTVKNAITVGFSAKAAVDKYKESRAEGKSAGSAAIRAGASAVAAEVLGPLGSTALMAAQVAPKIAAEGANALYTEYRRMNSASNFVPLGGVNFQDSQELATMRQSGMELAKMAQYNLEQSLMGAEAKHLHR